MNTLIYKFRSPRREEQRDGKYRSRVRTRILLTININGDVRRNKHRVLSPSDSEMTEKKKKFHSFAKKSQRGVFGIRITSSGFHRYTNRTYSGLSSMNEWLYE